MLLSSASFAFAEENVRIQMQTAYPPALPLIGETAVNAIEAIQTMSGGDMEIRLYEPGKLVPALEILDAVSSGNLDAGFSSPAFNVGKNSAMGLFTSVPFGPDAVGYVSWVYYGGGLEIWQDMYAQFNVHTVPCGVIPAEAGGWFKNELNSTDDLQGLKLRWAGLGAEVLAEYGVSATVTGVGDIIPNLDKGIIDGAEVGAPSVDKIIGMDKASTDYYYFPGWHQQAAFMEMLFADDVWNAMSARQQTIIETACRSMVVFNLGKGYAEQADALQYFRDEGINIRVWPDEMLASFRETTAMVMERAAAENPDFDRAWKSLQEFRAGYSPWASIAILPATE